MAQPEGSSSADADADRGFVAALEPGVVHDAEGRVVYDADAYGFLDGPAAPDAHPGLWRQSRRLSRQGLYEVTEGIYQVRGLDLAHMTLVEGDEGVLVIDTLTSAETATAALGLYRAHRGHRPVTAVLLTHPHADHFGGVGGVLAEAAPGVPVLAPAGFLDPAVSENVYAGPAMKRRATYMYGSDLPVGPAGHIGCGLGQRLSAGTMGLVEPTEEIRETGETRTVDGIALEFQMTPGAEAPAEMNIYLPHHRALCLAENAVHTQHNIHTLRGAPVRDARLWARYLTEALHLFAHRTDVAFATHHWPTWGGEQVATFLAGQRDVYAYLHDQTVRLINRGLTPREIAEELRLPPALEAQEHTRGYYGSLNHNVKGIYQHYLGWFDANPAHLWELPPAAEGRRWVDLLGGTDAAVAHARRLVDDGDLRFAATLLGHVVFADPEDETARRLLAEVYTALGRGCENAPWRNFYLTGAQELLEGPAPRPASAGPQLLGALDVDQLLDALAVRVDGPAAWDLDLRIDWHLTDEDRYHHLHLTHGVLVHHPDASPDPAAQLTLRLTREQLVGIIARREPAGVEHEGDLGVLGTLMGVLERPDPTFPVATL